MVDIIFGSIAAICFLLTLIGIIFPEAFDWVEGKIDDLKLSRKERLRAKGKICDKCWKNSRLVYINSYSTTRRLCVKDATDYVANRMIRVDPAVTKALVGLTEEEPW